MSLPGRRGSAILGCLLVLLLLSILGGMALSSGRMELKSTYYLQEESVALYLSESGLQFMLYAFAHPGSLPAPVADRLLPRYFTKDHRPTYLDYNGQSQFGGPADSPALEIRIPDDLVSWPPGWGALWPDLKILGGQVIVRVLGPQLSGAVATIESIGRSKGNIRKRLLVTVQERSDPLRILPMPGTWNERY